MTLRVAYAAQVDEAPDPCSLRSGCEDSYSYQIGCAELPFSRIQRMDQVIGDVHTPKRRTQALRTQGVCLDHIDSPRESAGQLTDISCHTDDIVPTLEQNRYKLRTDVAGCAGDEHIHLHHSPATGVEGAAQVYPDG